MSEVKFTPGPWSVEHGFYTPENNYFSSVHVKEGGIADVWNKEDAHLIAAAPELYEALENCIGLLELIKENWIDYDHIFSIGVHDAVTALEKARGEV